MYPGAHLAQHADKAAVVMAGTGWTQTFAELDAAANRLSRLLQASGLRAGDHVAICMENHPRYLEVLWGCNYAGLIYTAASSRLTAEELGYVVDDCGARVYITSQHLAGLASAIVASTPKVERRLMLDGVVDGYGPYGDSVAEHDAEPLPDRVAGTDMLYSSGTTGRPKGVLPAVPSTPLEEFSSGVKTLLELLFAMDDTKTYLSPAPLYHAAPLRFCMAVQACGSTVVVMEQFDAAEYLTTHRAALGHPFAVSADDVRPHAEAPGRGARVVRRVESRGGHPRRRSCPVAVKQEMIDWWGR